MEREGHAQHGSVSERETSMKVVILAGGLGTRLAEETEVRPKPMVQIGEQPILWHIMKHYAHYGHREFIIALGYEGNSIKRYFFEQTTLRGDLTIDMRTHAVAFRDEHNEDWIVHLVDTGLSSQTAGRIGRLRQYIAGQTFMVTYGDGVSNVDLDALLELHQKSHCVATLTAVRPPTRFGGLIFKGDVVAQFTEKPQIGEGWINGGFMVMEPEVLDLIPSNSTNLETDVLERLAVRGKLTGYRHEGFWQCMDTLRDKKLLESLWKQQEAPWKTWA